MKPTFSLIAGAIWASLVSAQNATNDAALGDCFSQKGVPVNLPNSTEYSELAEPYNLRYQYQPAAIAMPETNQQVQDAITCASSGGYKVQAKSGGHSYASFSSGGKNGSVVINLQAWQNITVDNSTGVATIGGGSRVGNIAEALFNQGKRAIPQGVFSGIGFGGHATHGGYGQSSRRWGLALDQVIGIDIVLANGSLVHATSSENSDIYWACLGACDSFGVVTNFYTQTHAAPDNVTYFSFAFPGVYDSKTDWTNFWLHLQNFTMNASVTDSNIGWNVYADGSTFSLSGMSFGSVDDFNSNIKPELLRTLEDPTSPNVTSLDWISYLTVSNSGNTLTVPTTGDDAHSAFYAKSLAVPESDGLTAAAFDAWYDYIQKNASTPWTSIINQYGGPGSEINNKGTNVTSYPGRSWSFVLENIGFDGSDETVTYMDGYNDAITSAQPDTDFGAYLNYVDAEYTAEEAHKIYYGDEIYQKLLVLKEKYDSNSVFWNPQAIGA